VVEGCDLEDHVELGLRVQGHVRPVGVSLEHLEGQVLDGQRVEVVCLLRENLGVLVSVAVKVPFVHDAREHLSAPLIENLGRHGDVRANHVDEFDDVPLDVHRVKVDESEPDDVAHLLQEHVGLDAKVHREDAVGPLDKVGVDREVLGLLGPLIEVHPLTLRNIKTSLIMALTLGTGSFGATAKIGDIVEFFVNWNLRVLGTLVAFDDTTVTFHVKQYFVGYVYHPHIYKDMTFDINTVWYVDPK